jgi:hypothetical protein
MSTEPNRDLTVTCKYKRSTVEPDERIRNMKEPANYSLPERILPKEGPPPLNEVDESAQFNVLQKDSAPPATGQRFDQQTIEREATPKQGPPPLAEVDGSTKFGLSPNFSASSETASPGEDKETSPPPAPGLNIRQESLVDDGPRKMSLAKQRFLVGSIAGFLVTLILYKFARPWTYAPLDLGYMFLMCCFFPGWIFRLWASDHGLQEGPIEAVFEYLVVATLYGLIVGIVHAVWPARKTAPKQHYWQPGITRWIGIAAVTILALAALHVCLLHASTATFSFSLDGKPLPPSKYSRLLMDGKAFASGDKLHLGHHQVAVVMDEVETFTSSFWSFYGKKDLGMLPLESSKGTLKVVVSPSPTSIVLQGDDGPVCNGETELSVDNLRVGDYTLILNRGDYTEKRSVTIHRQQRTEENILLQIGSVALASDPPDADYALTGNGRAWRGHLPAQIENVPVGNYEFVTQRRDWELKADVSISQGTLASSKTVFPYALINVTSEPTGAKILSSGVELGQAPLVARVIPGHYSFIARDGEEESSSEIDVGPSDRRAQSFVFQYGQLRVTTQPSGAKVILRGRDVGYAPLTLPKVRAGAATLQLQLDGYESKEEVFDIIADRLNDEFYQLTSLRYLYYLNAARDAARQYPPDYRRALEMADESLRESPGDQQATQLRQEYGYAQNLKEANEAVNGGDLSIAREKADAALSLKPDDAEATDLKSRIAAAQVSREQEARQKAQVEQEAQKARAEQQKAQQKAQVEQQKAQQKVQAEQQKAPLAAR